MRKVDEMMEHAPVIMLAAVVVVVAHYLKFVSHFKILVLYMLPRMFY